MSKVTVHDLIMITLWPDHGKAPWSGHSSTLAELCQAKFCFWVQRGIFIYYITWGFLILDIICVRMNMSVVYATNAMTLSVFRQLTFVRTELPEEQNPPVCAEEAWRAGGCRESPGSGHGTEPQSGTEGPQRSPCSGSLLRWTFLCHWRGPCYSSVEDYAHHHAGANLKRCSN